MLNFILSQALLSYLIGEYYDGYDLADFRKIRHIFNRRFFNAPLNDPPNTTRTILAEISPQSTCSLALLFPLNSKTLFNDGLIKSRKNKATF